MSYYSKGEVLNTLATEGSFWMVNWNVVHYFGGIDEAIMLGYLCSMQNLYGDNRGVFYRTIPSVKKDTTFDGRRQRKALNNLEKLGLIEIAYLGMPKKRHIRVIPDNVREFLECVRYSMHSCID